MVKVRVRSEVVGAATKYLVTISDPPRRIKSMPFRKSDKKETKFVVASIIASLSDVLKACINLRHAKNLQADM